MAMLSWNCQGLGKNEVRNVLRDLISNNGIDVVFLMETKIRKSKLEPVRNSLGFTGKCYVDPHGIGGGLALWWRGDVDITIIDANDNYIDTRVKWRAEEPWWCTFCYGHPEKRMRDVVLQAIAGLRRTGEESWIALGDFNSIRNRAEKQGGNPVNQNECLAFQTWIDDCEFMEMDCCGGRFTWSNKRCNRDCVIEKLDRVFMNNEWNILFPLAYGIAEAPQHSDHCPIIVRLTEKRKKRRRFNFEAKWLTDPDIEGVINEAWAENRNNDQLSLSNRLHKSRVKLTQWAKGKFGNPASEIKDLKLKLKNIQQTLLTEESRTELLNCQSRLDTLMARDERHWFDRSRVTWMKFGDRNSKYFHSTAVQRKRRNTIRKLKDKNGLWVEDNKSIHELINRHFSEHFEAVDSTNYEQALRSSKRTVTEEMNFELKKEISEAEIRKAVFDLGAHKAPGPDGFSGMFFQRFWGVIRFEVIALVKDFFHTGIMPNGTNEANLVLIPKVDNPETINDFRPIGCCNFIYKVIARMLTSRLKPWMSELVAPMQSAFVPGRQIQDNIIMAHEAFHAIRKRKEGDKGVMAIKLDLAKAYDKVSWVFLRRVLISMGFDEYFTNRIMSCVTSSNLKIMVNGEHTGSVSPKRGLRQGDPLSPYLFNFVANILSNLIEQAEDACALIGFRINNRCPSLSHLLFADDSIIFARADASNARTVIDLLKLFEEAAGQTVNFSKSAIYFSPNTAGTIRNEIVQLTAIPIMADNTKYLGLPMIWGRGKKEALSYLKEKLSAKIRNWKGRFLSSAGREILIKAVVSAMPVYVMHIFNIPKTFCKDLNVLLNKFWWGGVDAKTFGLNWMAWDKMSVQKKDGGIGFRDFKTFNLALLARQAWRLINNPEAKWVRILKALYFHNCSPLDAVRGKKGSWGWMSLHDGLTFLAKGLRKNIMNGRDTHIWDDQWVPSLERFKIRSTKPERCNVSLVSELIVQGQSCWDEGLVRSLFSEEEARAIMKIPISRTGEKDTLIWHYSNDGHYSVKKGYYQCIESTKNDTNDAGTSEFWRGKDTNWNDIWKLNIAPKIKHFIWRAIHNVVPTNDTLKRRHRSANGCCWRCGNSEETLEHMLFFCNHSKAIWRASCFSYTPEEVGFQSFAKWWATVSGKHFDPNASLDVNLLAETLWGIWKVRNSMVYEHVVGNPIKEWLKIERDHLLFRAANDAEVRVTRRGDSSSSEWEPPDSETIKINVDAAFSRNNCCAGVVAVARNSEGVVVGGSNERICVESAFVAECLALRLGSRLAEQHGWSKVVIESDNKSAVEMVEGYKQTSWDAAAVIHDIIARKSLDRNLVIKHVYRNCNLLADWLSKSTLRGDCPPDWIHVMPRHLRSVIARN